MTGVNRKIRYPAVMHQNNFALIHLIGACLVIFGHESVILQVPDVYVMGTSTASLGLKIIFVITGYLLTESFFRDYSFGNFMKKRLIRIYPAFACCLAASVLLLGPVFTECDPGTYFSACWEYLGSNLILRPVFALPGVFLDNPYPAVVNGSIWTIPVEIVFYLIIAVICLAIGRLPEKKRTVLLTVLTGIVSVLAVLRIYLKPEAGFVVWGTNWFTAFNILPYFLTGSLYRTANLKRYCRLPAALVLAAAACLIPIERMEIVPLIVIPYLTISIAFCRKTLFPRFFARNNIAYGVFLWGFPVQQTVVQLIQVRNGWHLPYVPMFLISLILTILLAMLLHRVIEVPVEGFLKRKLLKR